MYSIFKPMSSQWQFAVARLQDSTNASNATLRTKQTMLLFFLTVFVNLGSRDAGSEHTAWLVTCDDRCASVVKPKANEEARRTHQCCSTCKLEVTVSHRALAG